MRLDANILAGLNILIGGIQHTLCDSTDTCVTVVQHLSQKSHVVGIEMQRIGERQGLVMQRVDVAPKTTAAVSDPRFPVVREDELPGLEIEISALTPLREVAGTEDIEVGRHGILLIKGTRRAVFLPQVATEQGWDLATTLDHLALKAGLPADAWREGCRFEVFEAEICRE